MPSFLRRMLDRPSGRLARAVVVPLTALYALVVAYALFLAFQTGNRLDTNHLATAAETLARTWDDRSDALALARFADVSEWDRIWIVSAAGRIVSSSRIGEDGAVVDAAFWDDLPLDGSSVVRSVRQGGQTYMQTAARDVLRGRWAMILSAPHPGGPPAWIRMAAVLFLAVIVWLLMASAVVTVVHRRLGRGYDAADRMAARILGGEAVPSSTLQRERSELAEDGAPSRILALAVRLQEQAERAREAESRFSTSLDLIPDAAYVASFDGRLLLAGSGFRRRLHDPGRPLQGRPLAGVDTDLPMERLHDAACRLKGAAMTVDRMPVAVGSHTLLASIRPVAFRGIEAYLALIEDDLSEQRAHDGGTIAASTARELLDASDDLYIAFDTEARTMLWNRSAERLTGLTRQEVPDLRRVVERLMPGRELAGPFMDWLESQAGADTLEGHVAEAGGALRRVRWHAHELLTDGSVVGGALVARLLPTSIGDGHASGGEEPQLEVARTSTVKGGKARPKRAKAASGAARSKTPAKPPKGTGTDAPERKRRRRGSGGGAAG